MSQKQKAKRARTYARNRAAAATLKSQITENEGVYLLKLVIIVLLGIIWIKFANSLSLGGFIIGGIPIGCIIGLAGIHFFEKNQFDRKIWYALLVVVTIIGNFFPATIMF